MSLCFNIESIINVKKKIINLIGLSISSMDSKLRIWDVDEGIKIQEI